MVSYLIRTKFRELKGIIMDTVLFFTLLVSASTRNRLLVF